LGSSAAEEWVRRAGSVCELGGACVEGVPEKESKGSSSGEQNTKRRVPILGDDEKVITGLDKNLKKRFRQ